MISAFNMVFEMDALHQVTQAVLVNHPAVKGQHGGHDFADSFNLPAVKPEIMVGYINTFGISHQQRFRRAAVNITQ